MISDNLGPIFHSNGLRFLDTPSMPAKLARCRYIGTWTAQQPKWRRDNPDSWRPLTVAEQTALALRAEEAGGASSSVALPILGGEIAPSRTAAPALPQAGHRHPKDEQSARVMPPVVTSAQAPSARDEIIIDRRPLLRQKDAARILGKSLRTLQRWHGDNAGPPQIKIGRGVYYDPDELMAWIRTDRTGAQKSQFPAQPGP